MTPETAETFLEWQKSLGSHETWSGEIRKEREDRFKLLPPKEKYLVKRGGVEGYFIPENAHLDKQSTQPSPSGRYILVKTPYHTKAGSWSYTLGEVFRAPVFPETERVKVAEVRRNYGSMWCGWVEEHRLTGQDYLLTGEDYQGFTVVNLTTGVVSSHIPDAAFQGFGWCPTSAEVMGGLAEGSVLIRAEGCYWACPYEYRIYDFSNPDSEDFFEKGLLDLTAGLSLDSDDDTVLSIEDGKLVLTEFDSKHVPTGKWEDEVRQHLQEFSRACHLARKSEVQEDIKRTDEEKSAQYEVYHGDDVAWEKVPFSRKTYSLGENGLFDEESEQEWLSERALQKKAARDAWDAQDEAKFKQVMAEEPIYQAIKEAFPADYANRTGRQFQSLVSRWEGDDNPFHLSVRIDPSHKESPHADRTASLVWGAENGLLRVDLWTRNKGNTRHPFPRTLEGLAEALAFAQAHLSGE